MNVSNSKMSERGGLTEDMDKGLRITSSNLNSLNNTSMNSSPVDSTLGMYRRRARSVHNLRLTTQLKNNLISYLKDENKNKDSNNL